MKAQSQLNRTRFRKQNREFMGDSDTAASIFLQINSLTLIMWEPAMV